MPKKYNSIYGYFDFENIYSAVANLRPNGRFVECGTFLGKSTCYMAELIKENSYNIKFWGVDHFKGEIDAEDQKKIIADNGGSIYRAFLNNMKEADVLDFVIPLQLNSEDASKLFEDDSLDFVFLDAEHKLDNVMQDLNLWFPKIKKGGFFGGHDYYEGTEVKLATDKFFEEKSLKFSVFGSSFLHQKP